MTFEPICKDTEQGKKLQTRFNSIISIEDALDSESYQLIELIMQEFHDNQAFCTQNVKSLLNILITNFIRSIFEQKQFKTSAWQLYDTRLINLEKYISDNPNRFFSVSELAEYLNISTRHLNNIIDDELGISAKSFIDMRKAKQASKLLLETDLNLQQISEQLGFSDHNNFNRFFKRVEGMSPGSFRRSKGSFKDI
ncbi:MAG: AraC family transcriptional regulator [Clostridia bacterium]|nr:AraC family transcriptional regulator [Clostridia bacterium]